MGAHLDETLARSACYKLLSLAFLPPTESAARLLSGLDGIACALPEGHQAELGPLLKELPALSPPPEREWTRLFGVGLAAVPYETEYDPLAVARKGHRLADLLGFYEAFGLRVARGLPEFPDHISAELEFMALLLLKAAHAVSRAMAEARAVSEDAARKFLADHLASWGETFAERVEAATEEEFYRLTARLLRGLLAAECRLLEVEPAAQATLPRDPGPLTCPFAAEYSEGSGGA